MEPNIFLNNQKDYYITKSYTPSPKKLETKTIDWEQRRYEIAKECMASMSATFKNSPDRFWERCSKMAKDAIIFADELIEQLKGE